jgi:hypothetical protein
MEPIIIDQIPFTFTAADVAPQLHVEPGTEDFEALEGLVAEACRVTRPKAVFGVSFITGRGSDFVELDGVRMDSRVMPANLSGVQRVFPYVATCGMEVEEWSAGISDMLYRWWMDVAKIQLLHKAIGALNARLKAEWKIDKSSNMNPGSLPDWPITEQPKLFSLLGDVTAKIGVKLTDSMLMLPSKSVSGIYFATDSGYENCELCTRENCPGRRKPYQQERHDELLASR